jgi:hypothetical protein
LVPWLQLEAQGYASQYIFLVFSAHGSGNAFIYRISDSIGRDAVDLCPAFSCLD